MGLGRFGWLGAALIGFGQSWLDLAGSGCRFVWISKSDFAGYAGNYKDYRRTWMDLG